MTYSDAERRTLLGLARQAVAAEVSGAPAPRPDAVPPALQQKRGCFVTLKNGDALRGCIGTFQPHLPLAEQVVEMGVAAARDPRFPMNRIRPEEVPELTVTVSVLSPLEPTDRPEQLEVGRHGIYVIRGARAGCFLPEVATEMGWTAEEFLDNCCAGKAGLPPGAWREPGTQVLLFTTETFSAGPI